MPLYEYRCGECGKEFEAYKRLSDGNADETCPACGGRSRKLGISLPGAGEGSGRSFPGGSSCVGGPRRSPFR